MSAYYLKQVVPQWSLSTIFKGMYSFMVIQCIAVALVMIFPALATYLPDVLAEDTTAEQTQPTDDSQNRLEEDPLKQVEQQPREGPPATTGTGETEPAEPAQARRPQ
jgi:hypothetical protein